MTEKHASALERSESEISIIILSGGSTQDTDDPLLAHVTCTQMSVNPLHPCLRDVNTDGFTSRAWITLPLYSQTSGRLLGFKNMLTKVDLNWDFWPL